MNRTLNLGSMKCYAVAIAAGVLLLAGAGYSQKSEAAACAATGDYQDLIDTGSGGCTIGTLTFKNFVLGGSTVAATDVDYTTIAGTGGLWGFDFLGIPFFVSGSDDDGPWTRDMSLAYDVACTDPTSACIASVHAVMVGSSVNTDGLGDYFGGFLTVGETYTGTDGSGTLNLGIPGGVVEDSESFTPVSSIGIKKDLLVVCEVLTETQEPNPFCAASISFLENTVDLVPPIGSSGPGASSGEPTSSNGTGVPEPASLSLLAAGLMGLGLYRRRRNRA